MTRARLVSLACLATSGCVHGGFPRPPEGSQNSFVAATLLHLSRTEAAFVASELRAGQAVFFRRDGEHLRPMDGCSLRADYSEGLSNVIEEDPVGDLLANASTKDLLGENPRFVQGAVVPRPNLHWYTERLKPKVTRRHAHPVRYVSATVKNTVDASAACDAAEFVAAEFEFGSITANTGEEPPAEFKGTFDNRAGRTSSIIYQLGREIGCNDATCEVPLAATLIPLPGAHPLAGEPSSAEGRAVFPSVQRVAYDANLESTWSVGSAHAPLCSLPCSVYVPLGATIRLSRPASNPGGQSMDTAAIPLNLVSTPKSGETRIGLCKRDQPKTSRVGSGALVLLGTGIAIATAFVLADHNGGGSVRSGPGSTAQIAGNVGDKLAASMVIPLVGLGGLWIAGAGVYSFFRTEKKTVASAACTVP